MSRNFILPKNGDIWESVQGAETNWEMKILKTKITACGYEVVILDKKGIGIISLADLIKHYVPTQPRKG